MFNLKERFASKEDLEGIRSEVKHNSEQITNLASDVKKLSHDVTEIKTGIGFAKWAFITAIAIIPVFTTIIEEFKDGIIHPTQHQHKQQQVIIKNPDGTFSIPQLSK